MQVNIAVVGEGTSQVLNKEGQPDLLKVAFTPSKVTADGSKYDPGLLLSMTVSCAWQKDTCGSCDSIIAFDPLKAQKIF